MTTEHVPTQRALRITIRSMLLAFENGLTPQECQDRYTQDFGTLNIQKLGFESFSQLLQSIPTITPSYSSIDGKLRYRAGPESKSEESSIPACSENHHVKSLKNSGIPKSMMKMTRPKKAPVFKKSEMPDTGYQRRKPTNRRVQHSSDEDSLSSSECLETPAHIDNEETSNGSINNLADNMNGLNIEKNEEDEPEESKCLSDSDQEKTIEIEIEKVENRAKLENETTKKDEKLSETRTVVPSKLKLRDLIEKTTNFNKSVDRKVYSESRIAFEEKQLLGKGKDGGKFVDVDSLELDQLVVSNSHIPVRGRGPGFGKLRSGRSSAEPDDELPQASASRSSHSYFEARDNTKWLKAHEVTSSQSQSSPRGSYTPRSCSIHNGRNTTPVRPDNRFGQREWYPAKESDVEKRHQFQSPRSANRSLSFDRSNNLYKNMYEDGPRFGSNPRRSYSVAKKNFVRNDLPRELNQNVISSHRFSDGDRELKYDRSTRDWSNLRGEPRSVEPISKKPDPDDPLVNMQGTPVRHQYYTMFLCGNLQNGSVAKRIEKTVRNTEVPPRFF